MPIGLHDPRIDTVVAFLRTRSVGVTFEQIRGQFSPPLSDRTVHRLLTALMYIGVVSTSGKYRSCRYQLRTKPGPLGTAVWFHPDSAGGTMIRDEVPPLAVSVRHRKPKAEAVSGQPSAVSTANPEPAMSVAHTAGRQAKPAKLAAVVPDGHARPAAPSAPRQHQQPITNNREASGAPPLSPQFAKLFASSLPEIMKYRNNRSRAQLTLESDAAIEGLTEPETKAYIPAAMALLDRLTAGDAAKYYIAPADFAAWRAAYPAIGS